MEIEVIGELSEEMRRLIPDVSISRVKSYIGDEFWNFEIKSGAVYGSGASLNANIAFHKAVSEFVERDALNSFGKILNVKTSSGFAAHLNSELAQRDSRSELIERDVLLVSWFGDIRPCWVPRESFQSFEKFARYFDYFDSVGIGIKVGLLGSSSGDFVSVGMVDFDVFSDGSASWAVTTESDRDLQRALEKALISLFRIVNLILTRDSSQKALFNEVQVSDIKKPADHLDFHLDPRNRRMLSDWWNSKSSSVAQFGQSPINSTEVESSLARSLGRSVSFSFSPVLISYFVGVSVDEDGVSRRLSELGLKRKRSFYDVHPLS